MDKLQDALHAISESIVVDAAEELKATDPDDVEEADKSKEKDAVNAK